MSAKVVHVSSVHRANDPRIFEKECTTLHDAGYDVALVATGEAPDAPFPIVGLPVESRRPLRMTLGAARAVFRALRFRPVAVHLHDPELIPWIPLFRLLRVRVVFDSHEDITATEQKAYVRGLVAPVAQLAARMLLVIVERLATGVVAATPRIAGQFHRQHAAIVQNFPILDAATSHDPPDGPPTLVYVGWLTEARGAWPMLDAIERLGRTHGARLRIAGWVADPLRRGLEAHPGWQYVDFLGSLDRAGVSELLRTSTVGVVLFLPSPNHVASQPTKMFEYMAAGIPVLASDYPLWRNLVQDENAGLVVDPGDIDAFVAAATSLFEDPDEARQMGRNGRRAAERERNWANEARTLVDFYCANVAPPSVPRPRP